VLGTLANLTSLDLPAKFSWERLFRENGTVSCYKPLEVGTLNGQPTLDYTRPWHESL